MIASIFRVAEKGHNAIGVEGSDIAAESFFEENNIEYKRGAINLAPNGVQIFSVSIHSKIYSNVRIQMLVENSLQDPTKLCSSLEKNQCVSSKKIENLPSFMSLLPCQV